eukprot:COSAG05_NODE_4407_length_1528_cov_1.557733_2_plen_95_part_00
MASRFQWWVLCALDQRGLLWGTRSKQKNEAETKQSVQRRNNLGFRDAEPRGGGDVHRAVGTNWSVFATQAAHGEAQRLGCNPASSSSSSKHAQS